MGAFVFFDAVDRRDARMVQAGEHLGFSLKPSEPVRISGKRLGQDLQRHPPIELGIGGLVNLAHTAFPDEGGHVVVAEPRADVQRHELMVMSDECRPLLRFVIPAVTGPAVRHRPTPPIGLNRRFDPVPSAVLFFREVGDEGLLRVVRGVISKCTV